MSGYNPIQVRHDLLNAVGQLLLQEGIAALSVQKIAQNAGVTKGALFHHFKNKDELLLAFFHHILEEFERGIIQHLPKNQAVDYATFLIAYTRASFSDLQFSRDTVVWVLQYVSYQDYALRWQNWLFDLQHKLGIAKTDNIQLHILKCAVDGLWLNLNIQEFSVSQIEKIQTQIIHELTQIKEQL